MHHIYCLSGLGADGRIFRQLQIKSASLHYINWVQPAVGASLPDYALALANQVKHPRVVLLGVSFGGMLAVEITRLAQAGKLPFSIDKTILVSSCKCRAELPIWLRAAGNLRLNKLVPYEAVLGIRWLNRFLFDPKTKAEELYLKRIMLADTQVVLIKRFVQMILTWPQAPPPPGMVHLHGTADKLLIFRGLHVDYSLKGAGHFMVWNRGKEVSDIVNGVLADGMI